MSLEDVQPEHIFWVKGGTPIKNLHELVRELQHMDEETFKHHVNAQKNDFAKWVKDIIKDDLLAARLKNIKDKKAMETIVGYRIHEMRNPVQLVPKAAVEVEATIKVEKTVKKAAPKKKMVVKKPPKIVKKALKIQKIAKPILERKPIIIKTGKTTPLEINTPVTKIVTNKKTHLVLTHPNKLHEGNPKHYFAMMNSSYFILGTIIGVAIAALAFALL